MNIFKKIKKYIEDNREVCKFPFMYCEIDSCGDVRLCCPCFSNFVIGNILEQNNFYEIWNGSKANYFRKKVLNGNYRFCNTKICIFPKSSINYIRKNYYEDSKIKLPYIKICIDRECNIACITCRDNLIKTSEQEKLKLEKMKKVLMPIISDVEHIDFTGNGDPFASKFYSEFMKDIVCKNKDIKFTISTNGILISKKKIQELGIYNNIDIMKISLHAATKETYDKICKYGNFDKVMENIEWLSKDANIKELQLLFTVTHLNYKEIPEFLKIAEKYNVIPHFLVYTYWETTFGKDSREPMVYEKTNKHFQEFRNIVKPLIKKYRYAFPKVMIENIK